MSTELRDEAAAMAQMLAQLGLQPGVLYTNGVPMRFDGGSLSTFSALAELKAARASMARSVIAIHFNAFNAIQCSSTQYDAVPHDRQACLC